MSARFYACSETFIWMKVEMRFKTAGTEVSAYHDVIGKLYESYFHENIVYFLAFHVHQSDTYRFVPTRKKKNDTFRKEGRKNSW